MRLEVFKFISLVGSFVLASSTPGFAEVADGERTNFAADFFERLDVVKGPVTFGFGEHAIIRSIDTQTRLIRYTATKLQQQVALQNARTYLAKLSPEKKQQLIKKKIQLAVPTVRREKTPRGAKPVMIIDVPRETLVSTTVYELSTTPKPGKLATYDNIVAEYREPGKQF
jgi:hypothetical protein